MKLFATILLFLSFSLQACGDEKYKAMPFAELLEEHSKSGLDLYRILVPKKKEKYFLTTMMVEAKGIMMTQLDTHERSDYENFLSAFFWIKRGLRDKLVVHLKYSTLENGALLACGDFTLHDFADLLKAGLDN